MKDNCRRQLFFLETLLQYFTPLIVYLADPICIAPMIDYLCLMSKLLAKTFFLLQRSTNTYNYQTQTKPPKQILPYHPEEYQAVPFLNLTFKLSTYVIKRSALLCSFPHLNVLQLKLFFVPNIVLRKHYNKYTHIINMSTF